MHYNAPASGPTGSRSVFCLWKNKRVGEKTMLKIISKIQANEHQILSDNVAALSTVEAVILIIAVLAVVGVIFAFVINKLLPLNDQISDDMNGMPENMAEQLISSADKQF